MGSDIKPKMINGEPLCAPDCPFWRSQGFDRYCGKGFGVTTCGQPCIPALRQQRDDLKAELEALKTKLETHIS